MREDAMVSISWTKQSRLPVNGQNRRECRSVRSISRPSVASTVQPPSAMTHGFCMVLDASPLIAYRVLDSQEIMLELR